MFILRVSTLAKEAAIVSILLLTNQVSISTQTLLINFKIKIIICWIISKCITIKVYQLSIETSTYTKNNISFQFSSLSVVKCFPLTPLKRIAKEKLFNKIIKSDVKRIPHERNPSRLNMKVKY